MLRLLVCDLVGEEVTRESMATLRADIADLLVIQVWGPHERNDLEAMKVIARPFLPPRPPDAAPEPDYSEPGILEGIATQAGLTPETAFDIAWSYRYPDEDTLCRALMAPAGLAVLVGREREEAFKDALVQGLRQHRDAAGSYSLQSEFHFLIGRA